MPRTVKHGWTHRPRSEGGTDPIEIPAAGDLPAAIMVEGLTSRTTSAAMFMTFGGFYRNTAGAGIFGYGSASGTPAKAKWLTISENGIYKAQGVMFWQTDFTAGDNPTLAFGSSQAGVDGLLIAGLDVYHDEDQLGIWNEQFTTAELDHHAIRTSVVFNVNLTAWGETPLNIGLRLNTAVARTKNIGASIAVYRLSEAELAEVTIA